METAKGDPEIFRELLAESFSVELAGPTPTTTWDGFQAWVATVPKWLANSTHTPREFQATAHADGTIGVTVTFDWDGLNVKGQPMIAQTKHTWVLTNNPDERFARMKSMHVETIKPFQVVTASR